MTRYIDKSESLSFVSLKKENVYSGFLAKSCMTFRFREVYRFRKREKNGLVVGSLACNNHVALFYFVGTNFPFITRFKAMKTGVD